MKCVVNAAAAAVVYKCGEQQAGLSFSLCGGEKKRDNRH